MVLLWDWHEQYSSSLFLVVTIDSTDFDMHLNDCIIHYAAIGFFELSQKRKIVGCDELKFCCTGPMLDIWLSNHRVVSMFVPMISRKGMPQALGFDGLRSSKVMLSISCSFTICLSLCRSIEKISESWSQSLPKKTLFSGECVHRTRTGWTGKLSPIYQIPKMSQDRFRWMTCSRFRKL